MEKAKVDQFLMVNADKFPEVAQMQIREKLEKMDDSRENMLSVTPWKAPMTTFLFAFLLGGFGADRFYLGETGLGVLKLLTCGGAGIWALIDLFTAFGRAKTYNLNMLMMRFFWIYLISFFGVYQKTQIFVLEIFGFSFATVLILPFIISIIPSILRIYSLKKGKDRNYAYKLSQLIEYIS